MKLVTISKTIAEPLTDMRPAVVDFDSQDLEKDFMLTNMILEALRYRSICCSRSYVKTLITMTLNAPSEQLG